MKQAEVVWALAHIGPATAREIAGWLDADSESGVAVTRTWREGLLVRRKREQPDRKGKDPYEYHIRPVEE